MTQNDSLDGLLELAGRVPEDDARVSAAVQALARDIRDRPRPRGARRLAVAGIATAVALGAVAAFTGATTLLTVWLTTPPFQELPEGWLRTTAYVPVEWQSPDGEEERCRTYIELERADQQTIDVLDAAITAHDWSGFGQSLYDSLPGSPPATQVEPEVGELAVPIIMAFARDAVAGLGGLGDTDGPSIGALATTCRTDL